SAWPVGSPPTMPSIMSAAPVRTSCSSARTSGRTAGAPRFAAPLPEPWWFPSIAAPRRPSSPERNNIYMRLATLVVTRSRRRRIESLHEFRDDAPANDAVLLLWLDAGMLWQG